MNDRTTLIRWYQTEYQPGRMEAVRKDTKGIVPEDRLKVMARNRKISEYARSFCQLIQTWVVMSQGMV